MLAGKNKEWKWTVYCFKLEDHPENKEESYWFKVELSAGFGKAALINTTAAVFNNKEIGEEQVEKTRSIILWD